MPYWDVVMRSFRISWNHKYLWLIALFSGEGGGGFSFNYSQPSTGRGASPNFATIQQQVTTWVADHVALIVLLAILWLLLVIVFFILAAVCEGATVRASAEHDAERVHERGIERKVGVVARHHRAISIARDGKICTGIPARGRVEQRIGGRVAHVRAARRSRKELDRG